MNRERIAGHVATEFNPEWTLTHLTDPSGVDEIHLRNGDGWLAFDPREKADREQMLQLGNALLDAVRSVSGPLPRYTEVEVEKPPVPDLLEALRISVERRSRPSTTTAVEVDTARRRGPHRLGCPALDEDPDGIEQCECEPVGGAR